MSLDIASHFLMRVLASNTTTEKIEVNITDENPTDTKADIPDILEDNRHPDNLWLLIIDLLIFVALAFTSHTSYKKLTANKNRVQQSSSASDDFKPKFIKGLLFANGGIYLY